MEHPQELFASTVGPTKEVNLSYDASARSKGVAAVTFSKKGDANKAFQQYHNRLIDGSQYLSPRPASSLAHLLPSLQPLSA